MNKGELIAEMAKTSGLTQGQCGKALNGMIEAATATLKAGNKVQITGFCKITPVTKPARKGRNPMTQEEIDIPEQKKAKFNAGGALHDALNAA